MARPEKFGQNTIQELKLAAHAVNVQIQLVSNIDELLDFWENKRVVAHFAKVHDRVVEALDAASRSLVLVVDHGKEPVLADLVVKSLLKSRHSTLDNRLDLVRELRFDILFQTSKQERTKHLVETLDNEQLLFFVELQLFLAGTRRKGTVEPLIESLDRGENLGANKVEESPEFGQVVLWSERKELSVSFCSQHRPKTTTDKSSSSSTSKMCKRVTFPSSQLALKESKRGSKRFDVTATPVASSIFFRRASPRLTRVFISAASLPQ